MNKTHTTFNDTKWQKKTQIKWVNPRPYLLNNYKPKMMWINNRQTLNYMILILDRHAFLNFIYRSTCLAYSNYEIFRAYDAYSLCFQVKFKDSTVNYNWEWKKGRVCFDLYYRKSQKFQRKYTGFLSRLDFFLHPH